MQVLAMLEQIHARMQVKLARQGMPSDRETLEDVCMAVACLVQDPDGLLLHINPPPAEDYAMVEDAFALTLQDFAEEITALRALVAWLEDTMQEEVRAWVRSGQLRPAKADREVPFVRAAAGAHCVRPVRTAWWPWQVFPERCVPALSSLPGATPLQAAKRAAVPTRPLSRPHAATSRSPPRWLTSGIVSRSVTAPAKIMGALAASGAAPRPASPVDPGDTASGASPLRAARRRIISALRASIGSSRQSIGASCRPSHCRGWSRTSPVNACSSRGLLRRICRLANSAIVAGSARPSTRAATMARADTPIMSVATEASLMLAHAVAGLQRAPAPALPPGDRVVGGQPQPGTEGLGVGPLAPIQADGGEPGVHRAGVHTREGPQVHSRPRIPPAAGVIDEGIRGVGAGCVRPVQRGQRARPHGWQRLKPPFACGLALTHRLGVGLRPG
jgi:hypothetical protein